MYTEVLCTFGGAIVNEKVGRWSKMVREGVRQRILAKG